MKKRILFIIWSFTYGGGAERVLADLVNHMDLAKYDIDIIEYWHANIKNEYTKPEINILKPVVDSTKATKVEMFFKKILLEHFPSVLRKKYIKKTYDYEISFNAMIPTFLLSKTAKTIAWNHGDVYSLKKRPRDLALQTKSLKHVNKIVAISKNTYNSILEVFPEYQEKTEVINNSFDFTNILKLSEEKLPLKKNKFTIIFAGRLEPNKNPMFLVEVAEILKKQNYDLDFWLLGKGDQESELTSKIKAKNLENNVHLLGFQTNPYPYFKASDVVCVCSKSEGFPSVIAEGLALKKPFISTNVGGVEEMSDKENCGFIASTPEEFANRIIEFKENPNLLKKMGEHGKNHIETFTYEEQIAKLEALFKEIDNNS